MINKAIFREYDIRGVWEEDLTPDVSHSIGRAFGSYVLSNTLKDTVTLSVGRDIRLSSSTISDNLIKGIISTGVNVIDIGECPTPVLYFSLHHLNLDGAIMVTGSHNPPEYNGFKLNIGKETIYGNEIQNISNIINKGKFIKGNGNLKQYPVKKDYISYVKNGFPDLSGIKVVIDAGNGTAGLVAPEIIEALGADVIKLFCEPDGNFPNHHPDPVVPENLEAMIDRVKTSGAHLGVAYDGDADRIGVTDSDGEIIWGDRLMIIFARDILKQIPGGTIIGEVKCSQVMYGDIKKNGGNPIMWKTGHSLIKKKMKEENATLAGEMSGHIFFADRYFGYDDAIYATLRLLEILKKTGQPYVLKKLLDGLPRVFSTPEIRFECNDSLKFSVIDKIREAFSDHDVNTIDGARINFEDGWALVRASNTQPALVLRFEANTEEELNKIQSLVKEKLNEILIKEG
jgi:phosphomannomutase/phosphoglucomutase